MSRGFRRLAAGALLGAAVLVGAVAPAAAQDAVDAFDPSLANRDASVAVAARLDDFTGFDPAKAQTLLQLTMLAPVYDTILRLTPEGEIEPGLASSVDVLDPSRVKITLRSGLTFSDGSALDAEAVKANLLRLRDAKSGQLNAVLQQVSDVTVTSATEVEVQLAKPVAGEFVIMLWGPEGTVASPAQFNDPNGNIDNVPIGAGPYKVVSFAPNREIKLERREDGPDVSAYPVKNITIKNVPDGPAIVTALAAGDIDFARSNNAQVLRSIEANPRLGVVKTVGSSLTYMNFCKSRPPFDDPEVRRALVMAVDRSQLVEAATGGEGAVANQVWLEPSPYYTPDSVIPFDPEAAKAIFAEKGVNKFQLVYNVAAVGLDRVAIVMQQQLKQIGVDAVVEPQQNTQALRSGTDTWMTGSSLLGVQKFSRQLGPDSAPNLCQYSSEKIDGLIASIAATAPDTQEANDLWHQVAAAINDEALFMPLFFQVSSSVFDAEKVRARKLSQTWVDFRYLYVKQ